MMRRKPCGASTRAVAGILVLLFSIATAEAGGQKPVDKAALVREMVSRRPAMINELPDTLHREQIRDEFDHKIEALASSQTFEDQLVKVYPKYFNGDEARGLVRFYRSAIGQHLHAIQDHLGRDVRAAGQLLGREHPPESFRDMCQDYRELRGQARFCPALQQPGPGAVKRQ